MGQKLFSRYVMILALAAATFGITSSANLAHGQTSDNSSDLGVPTDNPAADLGLDNFTNSSSGTTTASSASGTNSTQAVTTPEFGSVAPIVLIIAVISIVFLSSRTRL